MFRLAFVSGLKQWNISSKDEICNDILLVRKKRFFLTRNTEKNLSPDESVSE